MSKTHRKNEYVDKNPNPRKNNERHKLHRMLQAIKDPDDADELEIELDEYLYNRRRE